MRPAQSIQNQNWLFYILHKGQIPKRIYNLDLMIIRKTMFVRNRFARYRIYIIVMTYYFSTINWYRFKRFNVPCTAHDDVLFTLGVLNILLD